MRANVLRASVALTMLAAGTTVVSAQLPNASPAATGLSNAFIARARGYDAVAWNPANLGLSGNPAFSFTALALSGSSGLDPISLNDVAPYSGKDLPASERQDWLQRVTAKGGENGRIDGGITALALSAGPVALQVGSLVTGTTTLNPDAFQALMFGNVAPSGELANLNFQGSKVHAAAFTSGAMSYGFGFGDVGTSGHRVSFGVTGKYVVGNAVAVARDQGSTAGNAVALNLPIVYSDPDSNVVVGNGVGMDVGFAYERRAFRFGAAVQNVFNSFKWDETKLFSKAGTALFDGNQDTSDFKAQPYVQAPVSLRQEVENDAFKPIVSAGVAYALRPSIIVSADARQQLGNALLIGPKTSVGAGLDYGWLPLLRLRAGASYVTNGWGVSGGAGIQLGHYELGVGVAMRSIDGGREPGITINALSIH